LRDVAQLHSASVDPQQALQALLQHAHDTSKSQPGALAVPQEHNPAPGTQHTGTLTVDPSVLRMGALHWQPGAGKSAAAASAIVTALKLPPWHNALADAAVPPDSETELAEALGALMDKAQWQEIVRMAERAERCARQRGAPAYPSEPLHLPVAKAMRSDEARLLDTHQAPDTIPALRTDLQQQLQGTEYSVPDKCSDKAVPSLAKDDAQDRDDAHTTPSQPQDAAQIMQELQQAYNMVADADLGRLEEVVGSVLGASLGVLPAATVNAFAQLVENYAGEHSLQM
jgi:hypothetical protein